MKNLILLLVVFLFASCSPTAVNLNVLENIKELGGKNNGVNRVLFQNSEKYVILFNNGTRFGSLSSDEKSKSVADIIGPELKECEQTCLKNEGVAGMDVSRNCSESKHVNMQDACLAYENKVVCTCVNSVNKSITRNVILPEDERQQLIKTLMEVIWIAPQ